MSAFRFPVETKLGEISTALAAGRDVILTAPPGSGKTTCVPPALLDAPWLQGKKIVMLEPRRLAARNCATYISKKLGEPVGGTVGYQVRLERKVSAKTRLEVVTEGLLTQRIMSDPELADVGLVIFDEFHERSLQCDLAYALALEVKRALRPDLRIIVMSATLDADEVSASLGGVIIRAEGRMYPVETRYLGEVSMTAAIDKALRETEGDILCFLPGEGEIRKVQQSAVHLRLEPSPLILPLYGALPKEEQDKVFKPSGPLAPRKVILATSIAETSVTIEGITCVIDSGLMRVPRFSPSTGMSGLVTLPLTQDRAEQRRGRAGRVRPGVCYRLWTEAAEASHPKKMMPEILDADLCSLVLTSCAWGALKREDLPWMTPPPASAWDQSVSLLKLLGALDDRGTLTDRGRAMAKLPMHPRLANMCWRGGEVAPLLAAIVEEGAKSRETDIRKVLEEVLETPNRPDSRRILQLAKRFADVGLRDRGDFRERGELRGRGDFCDCGELRGRGDFCDCGELRGRGVLAASIDTTTTGPLLALAYPDRVAKNRGNGSFTMVSGRGAFLPPDDALVREPYLVCCELDDRQGDAKIFLASPIGEDEIESLFANRISEEPYCAWDRRDERVKSVLRRRLGAMTLKEVRREKGEDGSEDTELIAAALLDGVRQKGVANLPCWTKESLQLRARLAFLNKLDAPSPSNSNSPWPAPTEEAILETLAGFVSGMNKWRDLEKLDLFGVFDAMLAASGHDRRELDRLAPTRMEVPSGSHMLIHYEGLEPTCEVRLQECFGLMSTPKVGGGRVPVVMTLLSPAQRPCAVTKELANFWREGYPLVRKDLRGRYPKHYWPEDPFTAVATRRVRPKGV